MTLPSRETRLVGDENLDINWEHVGSGGFGDVYRVRHKVRGHDVAIKILKNGVGYEEATLMEKVPSEFVLRVYEIYKGSMKHGIVMPYMRRGSVQSLMEHLSGPPPWPLAFRLAHQVALGMNFLHAERIVHQDLKPGNVLLTENLDARIADFGLSRVSTSALTSSSEQTGETGGTYMYMPPEAFDASYKLGRAFDIYSYGILLWSIVTGKEPYPDADYRLVAHKIPLGDRPPWEDLDQVKVEGLKELVDLMKRCWDGDPSKRPKFNKVLEETEELFSKHRRAIHDAVDQVKKRLEMALPSRKIKLVGDESLENWKPIGSGAFGDVYRASHKGLGDVAIKILKTDVGYKEATLMETVSSEFVLTVHGIYQGYPPTSRGSMQRGIVMQYMRRGSVQSLMRDLSGPPPWPLAFRLAHQVALGVNFLHAERIVHQDLKPSKVLLTDDLNARLADFGLSRVSTSALTSSSEQTGETGGTYKYMPPEAFDASYKPGRAFDIYSYGILLWSIVTGKEPYPDADYRLVALRIPLGDRPPCEDLDQVKMEGLKELVDLMKRCWDGDPNKRPKFNEVLEETEELFSKHKKDIHDAVFQVLKRLDASVLLPNPMTNEEKEKFVDDNKVTLIQRVNLVVKIAQELGNMVNPETYNNIRAEKTSRERMRVLYTLLDSEGKKVKAAFYDALKRNHQFLVEDLGGS